MSTPSDHLSVDASPSASPVLSPSQLPASGSIATRQQSLSVDAALSRTTTLTPPTAAAAAERPRALTANATHSSLASPSPSAHSSTRGSPRTSISSVAHRLSVSVQRSPMVAGVTRSFAARLAGSFSSNASPTAIAKQLQLHQRNVSVSRVSRASVVRVAEPTSQQGSIMRPHGISSPSHIPSRLPSNPHPAVSHASSHNPQSRPPSADHSQLQINSAALPPIRLSTASEDGISAVTQQAPQPATLMEVDEVQEATARAHQRDVSRSSNASVSSASSVPSSASTRQAEVEQAAQRLRSLDQELMHRKPSVMLHPISKKLSQHAQQPQLPQTQPLPQVVRPQTQQSDAEDERMRGQLIDSPPMYTIALDTTHTGQSPQLATTTTLTTTPTDPSNPATDAATSDDPATSEPEPPPPATGCGAVIAATISSFIFSIVYLPFTVAILTQSVVQKRPILPVNWQTELTTPYWLFSFSLFGFLFCFPFILVFGLMADTGIWSVFNNNVRSAIPFTMFFALYLSLFVMLHFATFYYAHIRKDLSVIHSKTRQFHFTLSQLLCTAAIIFEAFQLISPFTSIESLGLHNKSTSDNDSALEQQYRGYLVSMAHVFGVGQWQVQDINTYLETFWIAFGVVIFYAFALGYGIQSNMQPSHMIAPVLFELIPGTFYLSIVGRLFRIFDCSMSDDGTYYLSGFTSIECWNNFYHRSMCMAAFFGLLFYSSSAMFVACYRGDASGDGRGVKFKPVYLVLERTLRDLFAMTTSLIGNQLLSRSLSYPILLVLTFATYRMQPCSIPTLTRLKVLAQASSVWLLSLSFLADMFRDVTDWFDVYVPGLLVWGWAAGVGLFLSYEMWCWWRRWQRRSQRRHTIAALGASAVQELQLADDDDDEELDVAVQQGTRDSINAAKEKEAQILAEAITVKAKQNKNGDETHQPATVAITIDPAAGTPSTNGKSRDAVSAFTAPISTTPSSLMRPLGIKQQAIRHTKAAVLTTAEMRHDSVFAQPNMVGRSSVSTGGADS